MKDVFEFKGKMYERHPNWVYPGTVSISIVGETPDFRDKNTPREVIPHHLRYLNKRQLRAYISKLEESLANYEGGRYRHLLEEVK